mmetsp:Transcript_2966/g.5136  ORF Transcript_2966/g.5136 Transcript_2966/m.5136 type:complete len:266 (+) Transcript_2966:134-931(+)
MKVLVSMASREDDGYVSHTWRKQVTLPKGWLASPCERLKSYVVKHYNQAHPGEPDIDPEAWTLCCETGDLSEPLGNDDLISEVILASDQVVLRPGVSPARSSVKLRGRATAEAEDQACRAAVLVPLDVDVLDALRKSVEVDDAKSFRGAVDRAGLQTPQEVPIAEQELKDDAGLSVGMEWHGLGGCFAWDTEAGRGELPANKCSLAQYAERKRAMNILRVIELADQCAIRLGSPGEDRTISDIEASAQNFAGMAEEMHRQMAVRQ